MQLFFLRHGKAMSTAPDDFSRSLTPEGATEMRAAARGIQSLAIEPHWILTSPLIRARETATIVAEALGLSEKLRAVDALASGSRLEDVLRLLEEYASATSVMLVGHEPDFSTMIGQLIGTESSVELQKGGLALVELPRQVEPHGGTLRWLLPCDVLQRIAAAS